MSRIGQRIAGVWLVAVALLLAACSVTRESVPKAVFIIVDGIPADVIETTTTPAIDEIAAAGGYARAFVGGSIGDANQSPTISAVGYASLVTGTWANKHNVWDNDIEAPDYSYWDIFRVAKAHDPDLRTAIFSTWTDNRTKLLGDGLESAGGYKFDYIFDGLELDTEQFPHDAESRYIRRIDESVAAAAAARIAATGPDLSWVYLQYTDDIGHFFGDSPEFGEAVLFMDQLVGKVWAAVEQREDSRNEDWLLVVTTDHGRDAVTGKNHGGQSARERTIWIATNSERLNERFTAMPAIVDVVPTIAKHLGLAIPDDIAAQLDGQSFID